MERKEELLGREGALFMPHAANSVPSTIHQPVMMNYSLQNFIYQSKHPNATFIRLTTIRLIHPTMITDLQFIPVQRNQTMNIP